MTRFAPQQGSVQQGPNPLARRGSCCCCCSLRTGVIILSILLMLKSVLLGVQWYTYSEEVNSYYNDSYDSDEGYWGHDEGDDVISVDDDTWDTDMGMGPGQGGGEYQQGGEMGPQQGGGEGAGGMPQYEGEGEQQGGPPTETMILEEDSTMEDFGDEETISNNNNNRGGNGGGRGSQGGPSTDVGVDIETEEEVDIPTWMSVLAWSCVVWHFLGGLLGSFAGCNYKKCCAFMFYMWWVISMTVSFAIGVLVFYFVGFYWCYFIAFLIGMSIGVYFTVRVKQFYNLLRDEPTAPQGYSDIYQNNV